MSGIVYFIGAGPGDPRLLTLRGAELIGRATHVFADAEVHPDILDRAPDAPRVIIARGKGIEHTRAIVDLAKNGARIARVFAGDPLLFRWGDEEVARIAAEGVKIEIVAGVTNVTSASAYGGLVLVRSSDASPSVAFAAIRDAAELHDWTKLSLATDTLALVTDASHVEELTSTLTYYGRSPRTPAALLRDVSLPTQKVLTGTLLDMRKLAATLPPGEVMLLVGEPLALRETIRWFDTRPLFGKRVLVLRAREQASQAAALVRERGAEPIVAPAISIHPPSDPEPLRRAIGSLDAYGWIAFTSANGVAHFFRALAEAKLDARAIRSKVAAIGSQTAAAVAGRGIEPDVIASEFKGEGLADAMLAVMKAKERVLVPRAKEAREALVDRLREAGHEVDVVAAYETHPADAGALRAAVGHAEIVLLTSSSTAKNLLDALGGPGPLGHVVVASIGPVTTETAQKLGLRVHVTAEVYTLEGMLDAIERYFARS